MLNILPFITQKIVLFFFAYQLSQTFSEIVISSNNGKICFRQNSEKISESGTKEDTFCGVAICTTYTQKQNKKKSMCSSVSDTTKNPNNQSATFTSSHYKFSFFTSFHVKHTRQHLKTCLPSLNQNPAATSLKRDSLESYNDLGDIVS